VFVALIVVVVVGGTWRCDIIAPLFIVILLEMIVVIVRVLETLLTVTLEVFMALV
jgi:hypothetical protein